LVNSLGLLYVNVGHNPPATRDVWDIKRGQLTADQVLQYQASAPQTSYGGTGISSDSFDGPTYNPPRPPPPSGNSGGSNVLPAGLGSLI